VKPESKETSKRSIIHCSC